MIWEVKKLTEKLWKWKFVYSWDFRAQGSGGGSNAPGYQLKTLAEYALEMGNYRSHQITQPSRSTDPN